MNYKKHYDLLISRAISDNRKKYKKTDKRYVYYEKHHIIPKCIGGNNRKENLVLLTPEEHYVAHQLLVKIYPENHGILYASIRMTHSPINQRMNNKLYSWLRIRFSKNLVELNKEGKIGMKGRKHSAKTKEKISKALKGRPGLRGCQNPNFNSKRSEETKKKMSENNYYNNGGKQLKGKDSPLYGLKRSEEFKKAVSLRRTGVSTGSRTEETKQKMREARKKQTKTNNKKISVDGIIFPSVTAAAQYLGIGCAALCKRIRLGKQPNCFYL